MSVTQPQNPTGTTQTQNAQPSSLYVGDLSPDVTDRVLLEFFAGQGATGVIGGRVCRNSNTKKSLGYGYVNFTSHKDADDAMEACNTVPLLGRPVRIMWSNRDPSVRRSGVGNIFIKNLDSTVDHRELHDTFSQFGNILSCKIQLDEQGKSKGYGFVHFETVEAAEKAIATVHGLKIKSQQVYVGRFLPKRERQRQHENTWTNVYVKPLPADYDEEKLRALFKPFGEITSVCIKTPNTSSKDVASFTATKFGFVNFNSNNEAKAAVDKINNMEIDGVVLICVRAMKKNEREAAKTTEKEKRHMDKTNQSQGSNLYVKHLDEGTTKEALLEMFGKFGKITSVHLVKDQNTGVSKGVGYVCYSNPSEAQAAINGLHGSPSGPSSKPLYVALHEPKHVRTQRVLALQHSQRSKMPNQYMRGPYYNGPRQPRQGGFPQGGNYNNQGGYGQPSYGQQQGMGNQYMGQPKTQGGPKKGGSQQDHALANRTYQLAFAYIQSIQGDTTVASKLVGAVLKKAGGDQAILSDDAKLTEVIQNAYNSYMAMIQQQQAQQAQQ